MSGMFFETPCSYRQISKLDSMFCCQDFDVDHLFGQTRFG